MEEAVMGEMSSEAPAIDTVKVTALNTGDVKEDDSPDSKEKIKWKYKRSYRKAWECHPRLCEWLSPFPGNPERAFCRFCKTSIGAHLRVLLDHARTRKHINAAADHVNGTSRSLSHGPSDASVDTEAPLPQYNEPNLEMILNALATAVSQRPSDDMEDTERSTPRDIGGSSEENVEHEARDPSLENTVIVSSELIDRLKDMQRRKAGLILKVRLAGAVDRDFFEAYLSAQALTYNSLLQLCSAELDVPASTIVKIRKLPDTTIRSDRNVHHLKNHDELEVVTS